MTMIVTAPLVVAKRADGSDVYLYEGVQVPEGLKDGEVDRLKAAELIGDPAEDEKPATRRRSAKSED